MTDDRIRELEALCGDLMWVCGKDDKPWGGEWVETSDWDSKDVYRFPSKAMPAIAALPEALTALREAKAREVALRGLLNEWMSQAATGFHGAWCNCALCAKTRAALEVKP